YNISKGSAALDRVNDFLNIPNPIIEKEHATIINSFNNKIELKHITFKYGDKTILKDINLTIPKGKTIAIVGASGSGKSTLVDLIPRFHDAQVGEVLIDGKNIKDLNLQSVRNLMGIVSQEAILFNDSITNNISLGSVNIDPNNIQEAAVIANAHSY